MRRTPSASAVLRVLRSRTGNAADPVAHDDAGRNSVDTMVPAIPLTPRATLVKRISSVLRFVFVAVPGVVIMLVAGAGALLHPQAMGPAVLPSVIAIPAGVALAMIGAAMVLYGTGRWGQWLYLLPFLALGAWFIVGLDFRTSGRTALILTVLPFVLAIAVHRHYRKQRPPAA